MARPNLLLCFDAFGTLFRPRGPVATQYAEVARQCGLAGFSDDEVQSALHTAIKAELKYNPNYGKATGLGATKWWTNVIHNTFTPLLKKDGLLPKELAPRLLSRFASNEAYMMEPGVASSLKLLKRRNISSRFDKIVVGIITNSDDRVPDVLSSFGVKVSPLRYGTDVGAEILANQTYEIDFHCISYDVGVEKPERMIFETAELMLTKLLSSRDRKSPTEATADAATWQKVYVGDEYAKDVVGATKAGWHPVLLDPQDESSEIHKLDEDSSKSIDGLFEEHAAIRVQSIKTLVKWLVGGKDK